MIDHGMEPVAVVQMPGGNIVYMSGNMVAKDIVLK